MYQYTECRISYQLVTFIHFQSRIFAAAKKINIVFMKDSIDFGNMEIPRLFRKLLIPRKKSSRLKTWRILRMTLHAQHIKLSKRKKRPITVSALRLSES